MTVDGFRFELILLYEYEECLDLSSVVLCLIDVFLCCFVEKSLLLVRKK